jgi:uncharacterized membrane protein YphA (DoxX/SURF4 family)
MSWDMLLSDGASGQPCARACAERGNGRRPANPQERCGEFSAAPTTLAVVSGNAAGPWFGTAARVVLGGVLVVAGVLKAADPAAAVRAVRAYRLLAESFVGPVAFGLPVIEIAVGLALLAGVFVRTAALAAAVLFAVFLVGIGSAWARGLQIDCGCFGNGGEVAAGQTAYAVEVLRDGALFLVAVALALRPASRLALGGHPVAGPIDPSEVARVR